MRGKRIEETVNDVRERLEHLTTHFERLDAWLITHNPETHRAAEAYEGLRKQAAAGAASRRAHLQQLARMQLAIGRLRRRADDGEVSPGDIVDNLLDLVGQWASDAALVLVEDPRQPTLYEVVEGEGNDLEVLSPAFVDENDPDNPILIQRGTARRVPAMPEEGRELDAASPADSEPSELNGEDEEEDVA